MSEQQAIPTGACPKCGKSLIGHPTVCFPNIEYVLNEVDRRSEYRTRYAGQEPRFDEMMVEEIRTLRESIRERDAELLRIRTTQQAAAHELDNIAVEAGLGHSPGAGVVAQHCRDMQEAVRVLAAYAAEWHSVNGAADLVGTIRGDYGDNDEWTRTEGVPASFRIPDAERAMMANALASAAVDAAKGRGG